MVTVREKATIPPKFAQVIVNLENFLALTYHIKVVMYLSALALLCWLSGYYYCRGSRPRRVDSGRTAGRLSGGSGRRRPSPGLGPGASGFPVAAGSLLGELDEPAAGPDGRGRRSGPDAGSARQQQQQQQQQQQVGDTASSERANSADSSRSQPATSRQASRLGSLEADSAGADLEPAQSAEEQREAGASAAAATTDASESSSQLEGASAGRQGRVPLPAAAGRPGEPGGRIFSKVDEVRRRTRTAPMGPTEQVTDEPATAEADLDRAADDGLPSDREGPSAEGVPGPRRRKNWFMNVYSNLVRMLNGLRSSISEVAQVEMGDNDYQDKQLEMLAGKIDNWYSGQPSDSSSRRPSEALADVPRAGPTVPAGDEEPTGSGDRASGGVSEPGVGPPAASSSAWRGLERSDGLEEPLATAATAAASDERKANEANETEVGQTTVRQIEATLNGPPTRSIAADSAPGPAGQVAPTSTVTSGTQTGGSVRVIETSPSGHSSRPKMINSSTSIDSVINLAEPTASDSNQSDREVGGADEQSSAGHGPSVGDRIDESSSDALLKQSNKRAPNKLDEPEGRLANGQAIGGPPANGPADADNGHSSSTTATATKRDEERKDGQTGTGTNADASAGTYTGSGSGPGTAEAPILTNGPDGPVGPDDDGDDDGPKLDSRNGISSSDGHDAADTVRGPEALSGQVAQAAPRTKPEPELRQQQSGTNRSELKQQQQQQQIKGFPMSNGSSQSAVGGAPIESQQPVNGMRASKLAMAS